ncbi:MAG: hypothetical protein HYZ75_16090 [Elusimicrobia bacterium]|nr:hypothetical protein [Elusimicrobiota bacterium]
MSAPAFLSERRGQLAVPFLLILPSFILITIFLVEIGQISREKIRQQFAIDAAATLEMESYTDLLNRLAYINGVFPHRIFRGGPGAAGNPSGLYPTAQRPFRVEDPVWPISGGVGGTNPDPPANFGILHMHLPGEGGVAIEAAEKAAFDYFSVYNWLGDVATAQKIVFEKTTLKNHDLLRKGLWMNLRTSGGGAPCGETAADCGGEATKAFGNIDIRMSYLQGFKHCPVIVTINGKNYVGELAEPFNFSGAGLFQLATVPQHQLKAMEDGWVAKTHFDPGPNHFAHNFVEAMNPYVRARVTTKGGSVWPDTTPKYYTRLYP